MKNKIKQNQEYCHNINLTFQIDGQAQFLYEQLWNNLLSLRLTRYILFYVKICSNIPSSSARNLNMAANVKSTIGPMSHILSWPNQLAKPLSYPYSSVSIVMQCIPHLPFIHPFIHSFSHPILLCTQKNLRITMASLSHLLKEFSRLYLPKTRKKKD